MKSAKLIPINDYASLQQEVERLNSRIVELQFLLDRAEASSITSLEKGVFINVSGSSRFVKVSEVIVIEAEGNYSKIWLSDENHILTSKTVKHWQEKFNSPNLLRVHQSFLVNIKKIESMNYGNNELVLETGKKVSVSKTGKKLLKQLL